MPSGYDPAVARRPDPQRLYAAHRAGLTMRLVRVGRLSPETAERWVAQWETEASLRGLDRHKGTVWEPAWDWIADQRRG
jgi:hypothetical protein